MFEQLAASDEIDDLQRAADLYAGDLLDGLDVRDATFDEWLMVERQRLRAVATTVLRKLLAQQIGPTASVLARRLLALDPFQEEGHRTLMRLYAQDGEIGAALKQYERCREVLKTELDATPSAETTALYHSIREQSGGPDLPRHEPCPALSANDEKPTHFEGEASKPAIAVLPFRNLSDDPDQQYFSDGITEDIITELSRFRSLSVIASKSSFQYRGMANELRRVEQELGVRYIVEGSVRRSSDRIRITAQLVDTATATHLWAEHYDAIARYVRCPRRSYANDRFDARHPRRGRRPSRRQAQDPGIDAGL
jgi:TolB-like protein